MTQDVATLATPWIGVLLIALSAVLGVGVLMARSLFAVCFGLAGLAATAAAALIAFGYGDGALALSLFGAGVAPILLMAGVLLSARAAKPRKSAWPWASALGALLAAAAILWATRDFAAAPRDTAGVAAPALWLALLVFVAVAACTALLGYGERGVLERKQPVRDV